MKIIKFFLFLFCCFHSRTKEFTITKSKYNYLKMSSFSSKSNYNSKINSSVIFDIIVYPKAIYENKDELFFYCKYREMS